MSPPPGWYRDPHPPHLERWWDGTAWTEYRRSPAAPTDTTGLAGPAGLTGPVPDRATPQGTGTGAAPHPAPAASGGTGRAVALVVAGAVLVAAVVTGAVLLTRDGDGGGDAIGGDASPTGTAPTATARDASGGSSAPASTAAPTSSGPSADDPSVVVDQLNGISLPLPSGWVRPQYVADKRVVMTTDGTYDCPAGAGLCRRGQVSTSTASVTDGTSPEALAKADIPDAADAAYDTDLAGERPFGGIKSHRLVGSGQVAVAGRAGYFVRWRVTTAKGPGGYVQSLVFPSTAGTGAPVVVRFAFDAGVEGPPLSDMNTITHGIRPLDDPSTNGGVGTTLGP